MSQDDQISAELVKDILKDRRAERRWRNIRFIAWFALILYFAITMTVLFSKNKTTPSASNKKSVALIRLDGMIAPGKDFSAEETLPILEEAYSDKNITGVVLDINSPGGTPVQAAIIHDAIIRLKNKYHKKTIIVGEDMLTSGAYFVAVAADKIYVNPNTITGSIGVIMKGFGFVELMKKLGIERRVYMAGTDKDRLDPFLPQTPEDTKKIAEVIAEVHQNFVSVVEAGRKGKLHGDPTVLFSGDFWSGIGALKLGLVDGLGDLNSVSEKEFPNTAYVEYGNSNNLIKLITGQLGTAVDRLFLS